MITDKLDWKNMWDQPTEVMESGRDGATTLIAKDMEAILNSVTSLHLMVLILVLLEVQSIFM